MSINIRPLEEKDLDTADEIMRTAFGTFNGMEEPMRFMGDGGCVRNRWQAHPELSLGAWIDGELVGSNFVTLWGSFGFFGPLSIAPAHWGKGYARELLEPAVSIIDNSGVQLSGLYTYPDSPKHLHLYQSFGYHPRMLTFVMEKHLHVHDRPLTEEKSDKITSGLYSELTDNSREQTLSECRAVTESLFPGLDTTGEVAAVCQQNLGETILLREGDELVAFAVCHHGKGSEGDSSTCFIKCAAVRRKREGDGTAGRFLQLLAAVEDYSRDTGVSRVTSGVNSARRKAYSALLESGYRIQLTGISMHRPDATGFSGSDDFVLDDWR